MPIDRNRSQAARVAQFRRARFWLVCLFFFIWAALILGRLFWLQVVRHAEYVERADKQQQRTVEVAPRRGVLYDRNLHELAMTVQVDSVYADPAEIADKPAVAHQLAMLVHVDDNDTRTSEAQILERLNASQHFAWIARRLPNEVSARVHELVRTDNLKGIYFQKEFQRSYPGSEIAAQVLGYVGADDNGLGGLELKYEAQLHGQPGRMFTAVDAHSHVMGSTEREPAAGRNLVLTIDENVQFLAERALDRAMEAYHPDNGTIVVQDVHTGQILALAIRPSFDPNMARSTTPALLRNHAVSDVYEPGSTFKLVTYSAALDQHVATPDDMVDCQGGAITLAGRVIHDDKSDHFGVIPVHRALEVSSDVAAVKLALKVGQDRFYQYVRDFGFGQRTGIESPGETRGLLRPVAKWSGSSIGSIAMGQEVGVTPVQLVSMVSTIANGGTYLPPHILMPDDGTNTPQAHPFKPGVSLPNPLPAGAHRVISEVAAAQMRHMMEGVVLYGTGKPAQLNGYSSGGKTGTAQKIDPATHKYSKTMHVASFAGIAPVNNPVIAVAVVIDNPHGAYYGTTVSAPVFGDVAQQILEYLGVPHDVDVHMQHPRDKAPVRIAEDEGTEHVGDINALYTAANELPNDDPLRDQGPAVAQAQHAAVASPAAKPAAQSSAASTPARSQTVAAAPHVAPAVTVHTGRMLTVPRLTGLAVRQVIEQSAAAGFDVQIVGSGVAREQLPAAGSSVVAGTQIVVRCGR